MAGHQHDTVASVDAAKGDRNISAPRSNQAQRMQDMLEDDDVREALRLLHAEKPAADRPKSDQEGA